MTIGGPACRRPRHHVRKLHLIRTKTGCEVAPICNLQVGASTCDAIENTCGGAKLPLAPLPTGSSNKWRCSCGQWVHWRIAHWPWPSPGVAAARA